MSFHSSASLEFVEGIARPSISFASHIPRHAVYFLSSKSHGRIEVIGRLPFGPAHLTLEKDRVNCLFLLYSQPKGSTQNSRSWFCWNRRSSIDRSQRCACHTYMSQERLEAKFKDKVPSSLPTTSTFLVASGDDSSRDSILDPRDVLEDLLSETEIGTVEASVKESLRESFEKSLHSFLLGRTVAGSRKQHRNADRLWTKLKKLASPRIQGILLLNVLTILYVAG